MKHEPTAGNPFRGDKVFAPDHDDTCGCGVIMHTGEEHSEAGPVLFISAVAVEPCSDIRMQSLLEWLAGIIAGRCVFCAGIAWNDLREGRTVDQSGAAACRHRVTS